MTKQDVGKEFLSWQSQLKSAETLQELIINSIEFECNSEKFYLVPFCEFDSLKKDRIELLLRWRSDNQFAYPSRFEVTFEGTKNWVKNQVILNNQRVLFWVANSNFEYLGHLGVVYKKEDQTFEIDNVLRGSLRIRGLMRSSLQALENEIEIEFSLKQFSLRVLESNSHAIGFYLSLGYEEYERISLVSKSSRNRIDFVEGAPAEDFFISMSKSSANLRPPLSRILTAGPSISNREILYTYKATKNGWNEQHSSFIAAFERDFAEYVGAKFAMATSSCTGALHLALLSLGIGKGDEVIVPDITWVATASAVMYVGAKPVFADIKRDDWTVDSKSIESLINEKTKAIIPVHLYGFAAEMVEIRKIALANNLFVIEDAAPAIGTEIGKQKAGTFGHFGCYSFQGAKLLVTGEGGMLVTDDETLYQKARKIQDHGRRPGTFWIEELGHKYKMNNITAALGLAQLERADNQIFRKRRINEWYRENLGNLKDISFQSETENTKSIFWMTSIALNRESGISREAIFKLLAANGIDTRPVFPSISRYSIWGYSPKAQDVASEISENGINLPSGVLLTRSDVDRVSEVLRSVLC